MLRALEARLLEAGRKLRQLEQGLSQDSPATISDGEAEDDFPATDALRANQVEAELAALKKLLNDEEKS